MQAKTIINLIDKDFRRRAAIGHLVADLSIHIEPFEDLAELASRWPANAIIMVHEDGLAECLGAIRERGDWQPVIAYSQQPTTYQVVDAIAKGATEYLSWPFTKDEFAFAVERVQHQATNLRGILAREALARARLSRLSPREMQVLSSVAAGLSNREIGKKLSISPRTVEIHRSNMLTKIGVSRTPHAVRVALEAGISID